MLKALLPSKISIQCQFHGDTYSHEMNKGAVGFFRIISSRAAMKVSDSIRVVSKFQEAEIQQVAGGLSARFVIAPIPIDYSKIPNRDDFSNVYDIALIGRLHNERGIVQAVSILKQLISSLPSVKIVIVGEGPERKYLEKNLHDEIAQGFIQLPGALHGYKLRKIYAGSKVLLSTAPREGYGLTLREAILSGMRVIARDSLGARETAKDFPAALQFFTSTIEAVEQVLNVVNTERNLTELSEYSAFQAKAEEESLKRLVESWIRD
jgi:glycosyltransferase involved in cell wall biosynthesis